jgi:hypothetical protein
MSHVTPMSAAVDSAWHADTDAGEGWLQPHAASKCTMPPPSRVAGPPPSRAHMHDGHQLLTRVWVVPAQHLPMLAIPRGPLRGHNEFVER